MDYKKPNLFSINKKQRRQRSNNLYYKRNLKNEVFPIKLSIFGTCWSYGDNFKQYCFSSGRSNN